ncbi:hypothetical protein C1X16_27080, partial [Pseudomonas sp. FW305-3-2-15-C-R2A1]|uniref:hypothetical protein n=2 Tax=unclassified Pseudomonas TaxID=196821 RepID=UPI000C88CF3A
PPMAVGQSLMSWLTHRHRGQAPSHSLIFMYQLKGGLLWLWPGWGKSVLLTFALFKSEPP